MGPINARTLQDVKKNHDEKRKDDRRERFTNKEAHNGQHVQMLKQVRTPPAHVREERTYPKLVEQEGDKGRYGDLEFNLGESIFSAYDKTKMRKAKIMIIADSDYIDTSKSWT